VPATIEAVTIFTVLIAPGYLLNQGISQGRNVDAGRPDLHVLARAVVASVIWLLITWWWATGDLIRWVGDDAIDAHSPWAVIWRSVVLIIGPYVVGHLLGLAVARKWRYVSPALRALGIASTRGTPWDFAWQRVADASGPVLVIVTLDDGSKVAGQFAEYSRATVSPQDPEVYLEQAYEVRQDGKKGSLVVYDRGVHVSGARITAIAFQEPSGGGP
jgi:Family of unknown function (DUF6338)